MTPVFIHTDTNNLTGSVPEELNELLAGLSSCYLGTCCLGAVVCVNIDSFYVLYRFMIWVCLKPTNKSKLKLTRSSHVLLLS